MSNVSVTVAGSSPAGISDGATLQDRGADRQPQRAADRRQHEAFGQQLADDAPPAGAERRRGRRARARATVARASSRLATLAQQMSSTKPTTPRNSIDVRRRSLPIIASCIGSSVTPRPLLVCRDTRAPAPSATAREIGLRGLERDAGLQPSDRLQHVGAARARAAASWIGTHRPDAGAARSAAKSFGTTPTTVHSDAVEPDLAADDRPDPR